MTTSELTSETDGGDWEARIGGLLDELTRVQGELLAHLDAKRRALLAGDKQSLLASADRERKLAENLQACQQQRQELLQQAAAAGLESDNIQQLVAAVTAGSRGELTSAITQARQRSRLLQHHSLSNWVAVQRTLLHLSQMVEVIATAGRGAPTYEKKGRCTASGALVDQAV